MVLKFPYLPQPQHGSLLSFLRKNKSSIYNDHCVLLDIALQVRPVYCYTLTPPVIPVIPELVLYL